MKKYFIIIAFLIFISTATNVFAEQIYLNNDASLQTEFKIETNEGFIWQGDIVKADTSIFRVLQEVLAIPGNLTESINKNGVIKIGNKIQVTGMSKNGIKIAKEIKIISALHAPIPSNDIDALISTFKKLVLK